MPSYVTPKKNAQFIFYIGLPSVANQDNFQANPTLATGDVTVSVDGAAATNLTTLPSADPSGGKRVKVTLSASEMNGDNIQVVFSDQAGAEWKDVLVNIQTTTGQVDDLATSAMFNSTQLSDSVAAEGALPTPFQALLMIARILMERDVVGTTLTVKKEDGSTTSMTFQLNSATNPTSQTRIS